MDVPSLRVHNLSGLYESFRDGISAVLLDRSYFLSF